MMDSIKERRAKYCQEHREEIAERMHQWYQENKEQQRQYRLAHRDEKRDYARWDYLRHQDERKVKDRNRQIALKREVLGHYGNGKLACVTCGFDDIKALSIDHINGGGRNHIRGLHGRGGAPFYRLLRRNGYPEGYQTLCMNCQWIKRFDKREWGERCSPIGG